MGIIEEFSLLEKYGLRPLPYGCAKSKEEAKRLAKKIGYPIALKVVSDEISHKSDLGGVKIGIRNEASLSIAYDEISELSKSHPLKGILVQKMARKGIELIIGGKKDPQFGHMIVLGLGGVYVEIFRDISARLCPINERDVEEMVAELKSHPIIMGARGQKGINLNSLKKLMLAACRMLSREDLKELDLNPAIFDDRGYDLVDVRMVR